MNNNTVPAFVLLREIMNKTIQEVINTQERKLRRGAVVGELRR